MEGDFGK
jgi:hypothetical protein